MNLATLLNESINLAENKHSTLVDEHLNLTNLSIVQNEFLNLTKWTSQQSLRNFQWPLYLSKWAPQPYEMDFLTLVKDPRNLVKWTLQPD